MVITLAEAVERYRGVTHFSNAYDWYRRHAASLQRVAVTGLAGWRSTPEPVGLAGQGASGKPAAYRW